MNARKFFRRRLGEWVFGSAVAWGCAAPFGAGADLMGGQSTGHCIGTQAATCTGAAGCGSYQYCQCILGQGGNCGPTNIVCPQDLGCYGYNTGDCDVSVAGMCPIYYPPPPP